VNIEIYTDDSLFDTLAPEWNALLGDSRGNHVFLTLEWQQTWWQSYRPGDLHVIAIRDDAGVLNGLASCFIDHNPQYGRMLRFVGCVEVADYLEVIIRRGAEQAVFTTLVDYLMGEGLAHWDRLDFCNVREGSPTLEIMPDLLEARGLDVTVKFEDVCPVIDLPGTWDEYLAMLDGKQRREVRRKMRRADGHGLTWRVVGPEDDLDAEVVSFIRLMEASAPDKTEFMTLPGNRDFFTRLAPAMMAKGWLQLVFLDFKGAPIAAYLNFDYANRIQVYNSGLDPDQMALSPGWVLLGHTIQHAIEQGRDEFDFLQGDEEYKHRMGGQDVKVWMLMADK
jgi:CelD/BcsL family acetyltransferase involved in cellulose biosynthesis